MQLNKQHSTMSNAHYTKTQNMSFGLQANNDNVEITCILIGSLDFVSKLPLCVKVKLFKDYNL